MMCPNREHDGADRHDRAHAHAFIRDHVGWADDADEYLAKVLTRAGEILADRKADMERLTAELLQRCTLGHDDVMTICPANDMADWEI